MEDYSFMLEMQKMFVDWLRKQGGNVILLSMGIVWLYYSNAAQITELKAENQHNARVVVELNEEIRKCDTERARLEARVEWLVSELSSRFPQLKRQN